MRQVIVTNAGRGTTLGTAIGVADRWWPRFRGMLGRPPLARGEGLLLSPCRAVHMIGMQYSLDVAFLSRDGEVVAAYPGLAPGARTAYHRHAQNALELPAGTLGESETREGDRLILSEQESP